MLANSGDEAGLMNDSVSGSASLTHTGRVRDHNEDTYGVAPDTGLWFVADGMGGYAGGDVASTIARDVIIDSVRAGEGVKTSILAAHDSIVKAAQDGKGSPHMGSTVVALRSTGADYLIAWVGDSRAYLWNGELRQLSKDHSLVQAMIDNGRLAADSPEVAEISNVITQCLGPPNEGAPRIDTMTGRWQAGDLIILCSDGLHGELDDDRMNRIISEEINRGEEAVAQVLVDAALEAGGSDNITVVVVSAPEDLPPAVRDTVMEQAAAPSGRAAALFALLALILVLLFYLFQ